MQSVSMTVSALLEDVSVPILTNIVLNNVQDNANQNTPYRGAVSVKLVCFMIGDLATAPPVVGNTIVNIRHYKSFSFTHTV